MRIYGNLFQKYLRINNLQKISKHPKIYSWIFFCFWSKNPCLTKIDKYDVLTVAFDSFPFGPFFTSVRSVVRSCWTTKIFLKFTKNNAAPNVNSFDEWIFNNRHLFALLNWSDHSITNSEESWTHYQMLLISLLAKKYLNKTNIFLKAYFQGENLNLIILLEFET